eukprot:m.38492 g.38492  ORF g.38492 m.38492 type:complete len:74 (+) comp10219_c0_seq5:3002-3223(+)
MKPLNLFSRSNRLQCPYTLFTYIVLQITKKQSNCLMNLEEVTPIRFNIYTPFGIESLSELWGLKEMSFHSPQR